MPRTDPLIGVGRAEELCNGALSRKKKPASFHVITIYSCCFGFDYSLRSLQYEHRCEKLRSHRPELGLLNEQLPAAKDHMQRIQITERFLLERIRNERLDRIVAAAIEHIEEAQTVIRIEEFARRVGLSQSALERRFRRVVGTSPKHFASILRLKNAFQLRAKGHDFTSIAYSAGYSDQSHFTSEFKRVTVLRLRPSFNNPWCAVIAHRCKLLSPQTD